MNYCEICHNRTFEKPILGVRMCRKCIRKVDVKIKDIGGSSFGFGWAYTRDIYARSRQKYFGMAASDVRFLIPRTTRPIRPTLRPIPVGFIWQPDPDDSNPPLRPDDIPNPLPGNASDRVRLM